MKEGQLIAAGIVSYNPSIDRLRDNISSIGPQVEKVYVFDNGSENAEDVRQLCLQSAGSVQFIPSRDNMGIAHALNRLFQCAEEDGFCWLLTLDQDSVCYPDIVEIFAPFLDQADSLSSLRNDRNIHGGAAGDGGIHDVPYCITSGNLVRVSAWRAVRGFNERLFIDMVDVDFCFRLRKAGSRIVQVARPGLLHELGDGSRITILGKPRFVGNYSAFRKYYIARNMVYVIRKYHLKGHYYSYKRLALLLYSAAFHEKDRTNRVRSLLRGIKDGFQQYRYLESYFQEHDEDENRV